MSASASPHRAGIKTLSERNPLSWCSSCAHYRIYVIKVVVGCVVCEQSEVMQRWDSVFIANTWRTLGRISEPQGCHYTVFLTSATFPSHPKTHDCSANKEHASALSGNKKTDWLLEKKNPLPQSSLNSWDCLDDILNSSHSAAAAQESQTSV